jgi:hypothetical protein
MPVTTKLEVYFPVKLTQAQRKVVAEIVPELADRLNVNGKPQRTFQFTLVELQAIKQKAETAMRRISKGMVLNSLRHVTDLTTQAIDRSHGIWAIPVSERVYQFKITLKESHPPIWRRIQVKDCILDKLHEHIQTAMGWTNSHLHDFKIDDKRYGDPVLLHENFDDIDPFPLEPIRQSLLQRRHRLGQCPCLVILKYHAAVVDCPHQEAEALLVADLNVAIILDPQGDSRKYLLDAKLFWVRLDLVGLPHVLHEVIVGIINLEKFVLDDDLDANFFQMRE